MKNNKALLLAGLLSMVAPVKGYAADKLYLHNGDTFTGTILEFGSESIKIQADYGVFDIPLAYVQGAFAAGDDARNMALQDVIQAEVQPTAVSVAEDVEPITPFVDDIVGDAPESEGGSFLWGADLSGNVNVGMSLKTGNSEKNAINLDAELKADVIEHSFKFVVDYNREEDDGDVSVDNRSLAASHDYFFTDKWFIGSNAKLEQDDIDLLDLRTTISSGLGYQPYKSDNLNLKFVLGPGYLYEEFEDGSDDSTSTSNWLMSYDQKFYEDLFRLFHNHEIKAPNDDYDAYLFQSKSGIRVPLKKGIVASGEVDFDWDNAPAEGITEDDTTYSIKLGYEWP